MPVIYLVAIFVILIITLSALRKRIVYELAGASLLLFGSTRPGIAFYSFLFLPGTIIHELSHWIMAEILQVKTGAITIFPDFAGPTSPGQTGSERLGSVATQKCDPFRSFLIGIAPFISGSLILIILGQLLSGGWQGTLFSWQLALLIYGVVVIGNSMLISESDRRTWPVMIVLFLLLSTLIYKYYPALYLDNQAFFASVILPVNRVLGVTAVTNLVMIGGLYGTRRLIEKITKRRII